MWQYYQPNPCGLSTGDCTVRAISKALDISWDEAHDILSEFAKNMCDMPHKDWVWGAVLRANGFNRMIIPVNRLDSRINNMRNKGGQNNG